MAYGMSPALSTLVLNHLRGNTSWTMPTSIYAQMHTGDPGVNGTANVSAVTTRQLITFSLSGTTIVAATFPTFTATATETIVGLSFWSAASSGTFYWSSQLATPRPVINGDTPAILAESFGFSTGIAA